MIKVTENAKTQALQLMRDDGNEGYFIRVGVKGGGCSGLMYELTFDIHSTKMINLSLIMV